LIVIGSKSRYKVLYGGRGGGKSYAFADALISRSLEKKIRILCTREMQNSIRDSVHKLLSDRIEKLGLSDFFIVKRESIVGTNGSEFIFKGLRHNISEIKSTEGIDICWVEEAEKVGKASWDILIPTIRQEGSEIWVSFNPEEEKSSTYQKFVVNTPDDCQIAKINFDNNIYFPEVLRKEMEHDKRVDFEKYQHVWEGEVKKYGEACIFAHKYRVEAFELGELFGTYANDNEHEEEVKGDPKIKDLRFFFGSDFGFSNDPLAVGRMFIHEHKLYIDYEFYAVGIEIDEMERAFDTIPEVRKWKITCDSARPDTISFLRKKGFNCVGAKKGKGSVEDGIQFLRGFEEIVIHPRCRGAIDNFSNYKWKQDKITQEILPIPADGSDHWCDLARYALEEYIKQKDLSISWL